MFTEWRGRRRGDAALTELARTWAKAMGVLLAAGAVSGTLLSFEMGILWPGLMDCYGGAVLLVPALAYLYVLFQRSPPRRAADDSVRLAGGGG